MKTQRERCLVTRVNDITVDFRPVKSRLDERLVAYRVTAKSDVASSKDGKHTSHPPQTQEGVCRETEIQRLLDGEMDVRDLPVVVHAQRGEWRSIFLFMTEEALELNRTVGHTDYSVYTGRECNNPLTALENGEAVVLVENCHPTHEIYDAHGNLLPTAVLFEYINARMDNEQYDLKKAVEILRENENVDFLTEEFGVDPIEGIPSYNANQGRTHCISFIWSPTHDDALRIQKCKETKPPYVSIHEVVFDLDLLGLRAGGAAKFDTFSGSP